MLTLEQLRTPKIFQMAVFDLAISYLVVFLLAPLLIKAFNKLGVKTNKQTWLWLTLPFSILFHVAVGQETALTKMFFAADSFYVVKAVVVLMVVMGVGARCCGTWFKFDLRNRIEK